MGGGGAYKPIIRYNSNSTLGGVVLTLSGDQVGLEWRWRWELSWSLTICGCPLYVGLSGAAFAAH